MWNATISRTLSFGNRSGAFLLLAGSFQIGVTAFTMKHFGADSLSITQNSSVLLSSM